MGFLSYDVRHAVRALRHRPGFTVAAVLCLALGIGANIAVFALVDGALLRPMPFAEPDRVVFAANTSTRGSSWLALSWLDIQRYGEGQSAIAGLAGYRNVAITLQQGDRPERLTGMGVTGGLFETLGVHAALGRTFRPEEMSPGGPKVTLLTWSLWQSHFGGNPSVVGRTIELQGESYTVVGVMPEGFAFPWWSDLWVPLQIDAGHGNPGGRNMRGVARLAPGVTLEQARGELARVQAGLREAWPDQYAGVGAYLNGFQDEERSPYRDGLILLMAAAALVLLVSCVNVANLLLARAAGRGREMAIRASLGAARAAVARQLLAESLVLGALGIGVGVLLGMVGRDVLLATQPMSRPYWMDFQLDARVTAFALGIALLTILAFGLVPAAHALRASPAELLRSGGRGASGRSRWGGALVAVEVALAMALLLGAGSMAHGFSSLLDVDPGFDPNGVMTLRVSIPAPDYPKPGDRRIILDRMVTELASLPGVTRVGAVQSLPLGGDIWGQAFTVEGQPAPAADDVPISNLRVVDGDYFGAAGIRIVKGRGFTPEEVRDGSETVVVNESLARRYLTEGDPLGQRIRLGTADSEGAWRTIVGVVADVRHTRIAAEDERVGLYLPYGTVPLTSMAFLLRSDQDPTLLAEPARRALNEIAPTVPVHDVLTFASYYAHATVQSRFYTILMGVFSAIALVLAVLGVAGVMSFVVGRRTREIGIRAALGAAPRTLLASMLREGMRPVWVGGLVGAVLGWALLRGLGGSFYGVEPFDPEAWAAVAALLTATAAVAVWVPSRRAARIDPARALQED